MLEPSHFLALAELHVAWNREGRGSSRIHEELLESKADASDKNGGDRHQHKEVIGRLQPCAHDNPLVLAVELVYTLERHRIDVPDVAPNMRDLLYHTVVRCMETMVHSGGQAQCD